jgi:hypothetical protein
LGALFAYPLESLCDLFGTHLKYLRCYVQRIGGNSCFFDECGGRRMTPELRLRKPMRTSLGVCCAGAPVEYLEAEAEKIPLVVRGTVAFPAAEARRLVERSQNANFAISLETIQSFLDNHAVPYASKDSTEAKNYADIAAEAMRYTVLLECAR